MAVVRYVGGLGAGHHPHGWPAPETRTPGGDGATPGEAARPGRGGQPSAVPQSYNRCRARGLLPAGALSAAIDATTGRRWDPWPNLSASP